jgi:RNA polymerase sigma factor (sigma-70 family)
MTLTVARDKVCGQTKLAPFGMIGKGLMLHIAAFVGHAGHGKVYPLRGHQPIVSTTTATLGSSVPALRRYAATLLRNQQEADNLVHDCLVRALEKLHTKGDNDDIRTWLFAIMRNLFMGPTRRGRKRWQPVSISCLGTNFGQDDYKQSDNALHALHCLPEEQRSVLFLVSVESLTYRAVAQVLEVPLDTVMPHIACGRERLRQILELRTPTVCGEQNDHARSGQSRTGVSDRPYRHDHRE